MASSDISVATSFLDALASAARTGDREALCLLLAPDVEWVTPQRDIVGLESVREEATWISPPDHLEVEFENVEVTDLGDGRVIAEAVEIYRLKTTREQAYERVVRVELMVRDGKVARYERHQA